MILNLEAESSKITNVSAQDYSQCGDAHWGVIGLVKIQDIAMQMTR
jgi:hypothetical protein